MTKEEKENYVRLSRRRYGELTDKKDKGAFLDQFCAAMRMSRKNAIRRLSPKERPHRRRGRPFKADVAARNLLVRIWKLADRPCGKLLRPVLGVWIDCLGKEGEDIPDETFAGGILGAGVGIEPAEGVVVAPFDGEISSVAESKHAIGITGAGDMELLSHVGGDTVARNGDGFTPLVAEGDKVKAGQVILRFDREKIKAAGHPETVVVLLTNSDDYEDVKLGADAN